MAGKDTHHGIATRTLRASFWAYGAYIGGLSLSVVATAILARLLTPDEFGLVALALIAMAILDTFPGLGVGDALVIVDDDDLEEKAETAFAVSVGVGVVLAVLLAALGPVAAKFFQQPQLVAIMPALGTSFIFLGLGGTHSAIAVKRIDFRPRTAATLAETILRGAVSVVLALAGAGVWSLVIGYMVGSAASTVMLWILVPWRPHFRPRRAHLRSLLGFGGQLTGVNVMAAFLTQFDYLVVGRVLGAAQLGFYSMATRLPSTVILGLAAVAGRVLFPAFASLHKTGVARAFLTSFRYTSLVVFPLTVYLAVLAKPVTLALFGPQWGPSVAAVRVLCIWACASTLLYVSGSAIKARGRADVLLKLAVPQAVALVVGSLLLVHRGIVAVSWVQAGIAMCTVVASIAIARRLFGFGIASTLHSLRPATLGSLGLAVALVVVDRTVTSPWPAVAVGGAVGTVIYLGLVALLAPDSIKTLLATARPPRPSVDDADDDTSDAGEPVDDPLGTASESR